MSRLIKFRAWIPELEIMIDPDFEGNDTLQDDEFQWGMENGSPYILMEELVNEVIGGECEQYYAFKECKDAEIMQFTGLQDKNGVDAYEGNLYEAWGHLFELKFSEEDCFYSLIGVNRPHGGGLANKSYMKNFTLIGNIHDNPELLKDNNE